MNEKEQSEDDSDPTGGMRCRDVSKSFGSRVVLDSVSWSLPQGSVAGLLGTSGAGKTTLLRLIAGLDHPTSGTVVTPNPRQRRRLGSRGVGEVGMVFQNLALWPHLTALRHVECVLHPAVGQTRRAQAEQLMSEVQLPARTWNLRPGELSGGEAQRLALARALAPQPRLLLLDEPLNQVDLPLRRSLLDLIGKSVRERGITLIYVTHSWDELTEICDRAAVLVNGRILRDGAVEQVFREPGTSAVATLTGPVVVVPRRAIDEGWIELGSNEVESDEPHQTTTGSWLWENDNLYLRPQQVTPTEPQGVNRWEVRPTVFSGDGQAVKLCSRDLTLCLPRGEPFQGRSETGVRIRSLSL